MPTKHIPASTWELVEQETVRAVTSAGKPIKDTEVLNYLILNGLRMASDQDWRTLAARKAGDESQK